MRSSTRRRCIRLAACTRGAYWIEANFTRADSRRLYVLFKRYSLVFPYTRRKRVQLILYWRLLAFPVPVAFHTLRRTNFVGRAFVHVLPLSVPLSDGARLAFYVFVLETARTGRTAL